MVELYKMVKIGYDDDEEVYMYMIGVGGWDLG